MRFKLKTWLSAAAAIVITGGIAWAANTTLSNLSASGAIAGGNTLYVVQTPGSGGVKATFTQVATYINSLFSGDATVASGGAVTLATVNSNVGTFGSATSCITTTQNAKGLTTAISAATCTPAIGSVTGLATGAATFLGTATSANLAALLTDETGTGANVFGTAPTISSVNLTTAATLAFITGSTQCLQVNSSGVISGTGSACGSGGGGVSSIAGNTGAFTLNATSGITNSTNDIICSQGSSSQFGCVKVDNSTITAASGVISAAPITATPSTQTGTNYAFQSSDRGKVIYLSNASAQTPTIAQAGTGGFTTGWFVTACNINAGIQTLTPSTSTIGGAASLAIPGGSAGSPRCYNVVSDGTNYLIVPQGNVYLISSGTAAMGTSAISAGTCATVVTVSAPGVVTTDVISVGFNGDPTATTGYLPTAMLTLVPYPTANNINIKACNLTGSSITPAALTVNWRVGR